MCLLIDCNQQGALLKARKSGCYRGLMPEVDVWQNLMSAHALNKQRLELRAGKGCASLSMPVVIQCDAVQYYQGWAGGGINLSMFVTCTGLLLVIRVSRQASTAPLCIQSCYSEAGAARLMHLFSIHLRSHAQKQPCSSIRSNMFLPAFAPYMFVSIHWASLTLICCCKTIVRVGETMLL